eukprot:COSAG01_NODE_4452_length_5007_cov_1.898737_1_plen_251_part_00
MAAPLPSTSLPLWQARGASALMVGVFVGSFYLLPAEIRVLPRNHVRHIRARFGCVAAASVASLLIASLMLPGWGGSAGIRAAWFGLPTHGCVSATVLPLLLTAALFLGPLVTTALHMQHSRRHEYCFSPLHRRWQWVPRGEIAPWAGILVAELSSRVGPTQEEKLRTLAVGPAAEEVVFRGCMLPLLLAAGMRPLHACLECPLLFGTSYPFPSVHSPSTFCRLVVLACHAGRLRDGAATLFFVWIVFRQA